MFSTRFFMWLNLLLAAVGWFLYERAVELAPCRSFW
jgi:hypothetical protein